MPDESNSKTVKLSIAIIKKICIITKLSGSLAQLAEQRTLNPLVVGSIPSRPTKSEGGGTGIRARFRI